MSWTLTTNYNLKKIDYDTEQDTWGGILNENFDTLDGTIQTIADQLSPVGTILGFHKDLTGVPALFGTWVECNGQTLSDSSSPLDGQIIPNLNGEGRFLRGSSLSGTEQDATTHPDIYPHTVMDWPENTFRATNDDGDAGGTTTTMRRLSTSSTYGTPTTRMQYKSRPINMSVVWVMRVK